MIDEQDFAGKSILMTSLLVPANYLKMCTGTDYSGEASATQGEENHQNATLTCLVIDVKIYLKIAVDYLHICKWWIASTAM